MIKAVAALTLILALPLAFASGGPAESANLEIGETALQKLLDSKFKDGKIPLGRQDTCNNAYIETVRITISGGRVRVTGHLSGHVGKKVAGVCIAAGYPSNFSVSGVPAASGSMLKLTGISLDDIEKKELQVPLGLILRNFAGDVLQIDLRHAAESALKNTGPYAITLSSLDLQGITPADKALTVNFDFKLSIQ
jgi:hypothetical protein